MEYILLAPEHPVREEKTEYSILKRVSTTGYGPTYVIYINGLTRSKAFELLPILNGQ